ncbi:sulfate/molybdate ABC transporter ATP-binding protein [Phenylobacterium montanum]|uniref:Sulfate/molybdate ABC transporter ATP-binding protein n=1 Tax=Phenylobacterium montanum TaxID=2823693 RepID=A0A975G5J3_9CAUL|nr:sulfate/molybdate ABC transporter ATP-binding protein [Caulobacter sp. S6]QUD90446.1 sulfate/molybdate ABC transporter ATP-binding protein [Caulobacter sp. S6]
MPTSSPTPAAAEGPSLALDIRDIRKSFGRYPALNGVSLAAGEKEFLALLGPSGSGKTTLLRILAGLERPDAGEVRFGGEDFLALPARRRRVGMVFQHYALFRHMTVAQNIAFGLSVRPRAERPDRAEIRRRVGDLLSLVQLEGLDGRYPAQLSGGQRQRVALARALAIEPRMLLLDEPFGALDAQVRRDLRRWLREIHDRAGVTTVFVTHDQEEALDLADRVAILRDGRLVQVGAPGALYENPGDAFAFEFLGPSCRLPGVVENGALRIGDWRVAAPGTPGGPADLYFRPNEVDVADASGTGLRAEVLAAVTRGSESRLHCRIAGQDLELRLRSASVPAKIHDGGIAAVTPARWKIYPRATLREGI